jgi:predicted permease
MSIEILRRDLRYTLRSLRRDASFATFVVLIAGLGIGASSTVFSVAHTLLLRSLPFTQPEQLVWIANSDGRGLSSQTTQVGHMLGLRERSRTLSAVAGYFAFYGVGDSLLSGTGDPERLSGLPVSVNFFEVLGVQPQLGRPFTEEEGRWEGPKAVMLSDGLWRRRFGSDPAIVGTPLIIDDEPHAVVGILPASFDFGTVFAPGSHFDLYFPFPLTPETDRQGNTMAMIGRMRPGVTVEQAAAETATIARQLTAESPNRNTFGGHVRPLTEHVSGGVRLAVWVLAGAVGMVMLIVCANLSNLLLARMTVRQKELAIRSALGAGRGRLVSQMLTESLVLALGGAVVGAALAFAGTRALSSLEGIRIPLLSEVQTDGAALAFTIAMAVVAGLVFGLAPAFQARSAALPDALKDASRGSTEGGRRRLLRNALVVAEVAIACVLLVGAGLLVRSFVRVLDVNMGFEPAHAMTIRVDPEERYTTREQYDAYVGEVLRRVREIPGVASAGITDKLPLGSNRTWGVRAKGVTYGRGQTPLAFVRVVSDGYPAAMGIPIVAGRDITPADTRDNAPVVLINETMARTMFPGEDPIGKVLLNLCGTPERRVVGVVGDVRHLALEQSAGNEFYLPVRQCLDISSYDLVVRSELPPAALAGAIRAALKPVAPNLAGNTFRSLQEIVDRSVSPRRFIVLLLGAFAMFALVLASLGIYALISYSVNQRRQEIGIRMALGATRGDLQRQIVGGTLLLTGIGVALGVAASWLMARGIEGLLFEVSASDPQTFVAMLLVLTAVAALAGYLPARRASGIDPMAALRSE